MNNTYRLIWNELANTWVAVAENAKSRGKRSAGALLLTAVASVAMAQTVSTQQLPTGGQIVSGSGAISAQQVNQYLTQEQTAKARVESAKAQLDAQLLRLKNTQLLAPDNGTISARMATVGAVVGAGTEMFKLIRQGRLEWRGEVTAAEIGRVTPGASVLVTAPGGTQTKGKVRMLAPTVDAVTRNGLVYVDLPGAGSGFKPGMFARGEFELGSSGALTVAQTAVVVRDGFSYVYRVGDDQRVELLGGVKPEDKLVLSGGGFLSDGDLVKIVESNTPPALVKPAQAASK